MSEDLPTCAWSGVFRVLGVDVRCHTLSDGQRIIEADSFRDLMDALAKGIPVDDPGLAAFAAWRRGDK